MPDESSSSNADPFHFDTAPGWIRLQPKIEKLPTLYEFFSSDYPKNYFHIIL